MNHADVKTHMADYLEGDLQISTRALFDAHLDRCAECSVELEEMRATISLLRGLPDPEPPPTLAADVMRRIRLGEGQPGLLDRLGSWINEVTTPRIMVPVASFAAVAAVALLTGQVEVRFPGLEPGSLERPGQVAAGVEVAARASSPSAALLNETSAAAEAVEVASLDAARTPASPPRMLPEGVSAAGPIPGLAFLEPSSGMPTLGSGAPAANFVLAPGSVAQGGVGDPADREERRLRALDSRLDGILSDPEAFVREFASNDAVEQEVWIRILVQRATERGDVGSVVLALEQAEGALAQQLSQAFGAAREVGNGSGGQ